MFRMATGVCVLLVGTGLATAQTGGSAITALRNQVKILRAQESNTIKVIHAIYRAIRQRDRLTDAELQLQRTALTNQENAALSQTSDPTQRSQIRQLFDTLRGQLTIGVALTEAEINALITEESVLTRQIRALYTAQINILEQKIRLLERGGRTGPTRRR